ncbi:MAG: hypothetical protein AAFN43_05740 [Pseudomonadota bacterium]
MNSSSKPTGTRKSATRAKKPATIDLEAKEVKAEAQKAGTKPASAATTRSTASAPSSTVSNNKPETTPKTREPEKPLGRPTASNAEKGSEAAKPAETTKTSDAGKSEKTQEKPSSASTSDKRRSGGGLFGGLIGAAAAVAGLGAIGQLDDAGKIPFIGPLYSNESAQTPGAEIEQLQQQLADLQSSAGSVDLEAFNARIVQLEQAAPASVDPAVQARIEGIEASLSGLTDTLSQITDAAQTGGEAGNTELAVALADATNRLEALEGEIARLTTTPLKPDPDMIARLDGIETGLANLAQTSTPDIAPIEGKLTALEQGLGTLSAAVETNSTTLAAIQDQASSLQATVASVKASEQVARSVAVNALGAALENGDPITLALASIESLGGKSPETERLSELASIGIADKQELVAGLDAFTRTIQNAASEAESGSISDRFWANARNLVSFRSSGPQEGNTPVAILSRVKANVEAGNLSAAANEWNALPTDIQQSGEAWITQLNHRMEAFALFKILSAKLPAAAD